MTTINGEAPNAHNMLAALIDIYDDAHNNPPEHRTYIESAWGDVLREAREFLATPTPPQVRAEGGEVRAAFEAWVSASGRAHLLKRAKQGWYEDLTVTAWWTAWKAASAVSLAPTQAAEPLSGWVSVEERLPEHGVDVLAFWFPRIGPVHSGCFGTTYMNEIGLWVNPEDSDDHYNVPTHWHPIPSVEGIQPSGGGQ